MAAFEGAHLNLLQGVSQQVPRSRLPGQLTSQVNMLSDMVTGLRRRPGTAYLRSEDSPQATTNTIKAWRTDISGTSCELLLNTATGVLSMYSVDGALLKKFPANNYLKVADARAIRPTAVGESLFIANVTQVPQGVREVNGLNPAKHGYFYVKVGAISKTYAITVTVGSNVQRYEYTTPNGTEAGHAAQYEVAYIAKQLADQINITGITVTREGGYVFLKGTNDGADVSVTSGSGIQFIGVSGGGHVRTEEDLPPLLPEAGDGYNMGTGMDRSYVYYRYSSKRKAWLEVGAWGSVTKITNMPVEVYWDGDWKLESPDFEGRTAGDDETNPDPEFVDWGITGLSSYQGRLVILSGPWVLLSATNNPTRFYRSTVTDLIDFDPISIGSSSATSAAFVYAVPFNKDLVLFSSEYQALIPGGNQSLSPRNAQIQVTSQYGTDLTCSPVSAGRTLMYPFPRSADFFGLQEMLPSPYTDAQYVSTDSTEHLPKYMPGRCRFITSSSVASMVLFSPSGDLNTLIVHEYSWAGEEKVLKAWHKWTFTFPIADAYFSGGIIKLITADSGKVHTLTIDPRVGEIDVDLQTRPFMDEYVTVQAAPTGGIPIPANLASLRGNLMVTHAEGGLAGSVIGSEVRNGRIWLNESFRGGKVHIGYRYESSYAPSPPVIRDSQESPIGTNKMTLLRYYVIVSDSADFTVTVNDLSNLEGHVNWGVSPVMWNSPNLSLGNSPVSGEVGVVIPCRVNANTSVVTLSTDGPGELKVISMEFVIRTYGRIQRL